MPSWSSRGAGSHNASSKGGVSRRHWGDDVEIA